MTTERRKDDFSEENIARSAKTSKKKYKSKKSSGFSLEKLTLEFKTKPRKTVQKYGVKCGLYCWSIAVILSVLSLMGFPVTSLLSSASFQDPDDYQMSISSSSNNRLLRSSDDDDSDAESGSFWSSFSSNIFPSNSLLSEFSTDAEDEDSDDLDSDSDGDDQSPDSEISSTSESGNGSESDSDLIPQQIVPNAPKQGNKLNKKLEKELACEEEDCAAGCVKKMKAKCSKSSSCRRERERLCKRRCRKQRCEERCKDEPKFGYVEREQRMEKCKDECSGPTAVHNKCIKKCHSQFKPCKARCHEIASKYSCDRQPDIEIFTSDDNDNDENEMDLGNDDEAGMNDADDDEDDNDSLSLLVDPEAI